MSWIRCLDLNACAWQNDALRSRRSSSHPMICLSKTNIRLVSDKNWNGDLQRKQKEMTKNVTYSFSDGIAVHVF